MTNNKLNETRKLLEEETSLQKYIKNLLEHIQEQENHGMLYPYIYVIQKLNAQYSIINDYFVSEEQFGEIEQGIKDQNDIFHNLYDLFKTKNRWYNEFYNSHLKDDQPFDFHTFEKWIGRKETVLFRKLYWTNTYYTFVTEYEANVFIDENKKDMGELRICIENALQNSELGLILKGLQEYTGYVINPKRLGVHKNDTNISGIYKEVSNELNLKRKE